MMAFAMMPCFQNAIQNATKNGRERVTRVQILSNNIEDRTLTVGCPEDVTAHDQQKHKEAMSIFILSFLNPHADAQGAMCSLSIKIPRRKKRNCKHNFSAHMQLLRSVHTPALCQTGGKPLRKARRQTLGRSDDARRHLGNLSGESPHLLVSSD